MKQHDEKPQDGDLPPEVLQHLAALADSGYFTSVRDLLSLVQGRRVVDSLAGHSGFLLALDDNGWVLNFLEGNVLRGKHGTGAPAREDLSLLFSEHAGDGAAPLGVDAPYANEPCDIATEVRKAHGHPIESISIGEACFNWCFPDGRELDTSVRPGADGKPLLRVFWEQW